MTHSGYQGSFYTANWLILANFDPNLVIPEISVNQVRQVNWTGLICWGEVLYGLSSQMSHDVFRPVKSSNFLELLGALPLAIYMLAVFAHFVVNFFVSQNDHLCTVI